MEILGLLDTLEAMILEGFRIPLSKKTVINEEKVIQLLDKIRLVVQGGGIRDVRLGDSKVRKPVQQPLEMVQVNKDMQKITAETSDSLSSDDRAKDVIEKAYKIAKEVKMGADKYADEVLSNLEATSSRILRSVKAGRSRLGRSVPAQGAQVETRSEDRA